MGAAGSWFIIGVYVGVLALLIWQKMRAKMDEIERMLFDIKHRPSKVGD